jgi:hypothetical protein
MECDTISKMQAGTDSTGIMSDYNRNISFDLPRSKSKNELTRIRQITGVRVMLGEKAFGPKHLRITPHCGVGKYKPVNVAQLAGSLQEVAHSTLCFQI